ncbi:MAG: H-NS histone family protein [Rhodobacterales bacterium]|nr:H-NS histone family protein [Rhodobacterales bacterium]
MDINLNDLSLKELRELKGQVERAIASYEDRRKKDALAEIEDRARALGFTLPELLAVAPAAKKRAEPVARYANPANPADTWSGRGRKPGWFLAALAQGKTPEDMLI